MKDEFKRVGCVTHYYRKLQVGIIKLLKKLKAGSRVRFEGCTTSFEQVIEEMQFNHQNIKVGEKGQEVGIKVKKRVREGDVVYLVE